jgi:hypothetical protein
MKCHSSSIANVACGLTRRKRSIVQRRRASRLGGFDTSHGLDRR